MVGCFQANRWNEIMGSIAWRFLDIDFSANEGEIERLFSIGVAFEFIWS